MAYHINYTSRNFNSIRTDLFAFMLSYYPDIANDLNDSAIGTMLAELLAGVGDDLSFSTDSYFNETQIDNAQQRRSLLDIARTRAVRVPGKRPSFTFVDLSVTVLAYGSSFDVSYCPVIQRDSQVVGASQVFQLISDCDFSSPFSADLGVNRLIIPNYSSNGIITNYTLTKRELVSNGATKIFKKVINASDIKPFMQILLPENNALRIESIIILPGTSYTSTPTLSDFYDDSIYRWYEVEALVQDTVFIDDTSSVSDDSSIKPGKFIRTDQRFVTEYTDQGFMRIIFGNGTISTDSICDSLSPTMASTFASIINNNSLGNVPDANSTMFIRYVIGGGSQSNVGANVLTSFGTVNFVINGTNPQTNQSVQRSLICNNVFGALGGRDEPSTEELRWLIKYNTASQDRCVTLNDYKSRVSLMNGVYGSPYKSNVIENQNMVIIYIIGLNSDGQLDNTSNSTLRQNLAEYLSDYRMMNDSILVKNGRIINISIHGDLIIKKNTPQNETITQAISTVSDYFNTSTIEMGQTIHVGDLIKEINSIPSIIDTVNLRFFNRVGGNYSYNEASMPYVDDDNGERELDVANNNFSITLNYDECLEIKYPTIDIQFRVVSE